MDNCMDYKVLDFPKLLRDLKQSISRICIESTVLEMLFLKYFLRTVTLLVNSIQSLRNNTTAISVMI